MSIDRTRAREKAEALVSRMTLEEKASQLQFDAPAIERLGIPEYNWWSECLHGLARAGNATVFPQAIALAATFDDAFVEKIADAISTEARAKYNALSREGDRDIYHGLTMWTPNINIFRDPRWGRGHETYGEDPYLTSRMGAAFVRGLQGKGETLKTAACAKHYAVHSGPEEMRHYFDASATPRDMEETYLPAFRTLVREAGVETVMGAYNRTNGEPCCASDALMKTLREDWGFEGSFVSDAWALRDLHEGHKVTADALETTRKALKAGCDLNIGWVYKENLLKAVERGLVTEEDVTRACIHLMTTRYMLGILGDEGSQWDDIPYETIECEEHLELSRQAARRSCVLLKNDGLLPLSAETCGTVGVIGPNADSRVALMGNYHGTASRYITVQEGLQDLLRGKARVLCSQGCSMTADRVEPLAKAGDRLAEAVAVAKHSDTVVLVLGLDETLEGEEGDTGNSYYSGDKPDLLLPEQQRALAKAVLAVGKPTVIVLMAGSAIDLGEAAEAANAVLLSWYPGSEGGRAVAELLFGEVSPSGKLPVTFYKNEALGELPAFTDYSMRQRTYRFYTGTPLYPFGYGLTYGDMEVTALSAQGHKAIVTVHNAGERDTEDVLQLYAKEPSSPYAPAHPVLCGFKRVFLRAGETAAFEVALDPNAFTVVDDAGARRPGQGPWQLFAGFGAPDARTEELTGKKPKTLEIV